MYLSTLRLSGIEQTFSYYSNHNYAVFHRVIDNGWNVKYPDPGIPYEELAGYLRSWEGRQFPPDYSMVTARQKGHLTGYDFRHATFKEGAIIARIGEVRHPQQLRVFTNTACTYLFCIEVDTCGHAIQFMAERTNNVGIHIPALDFTTAVQPSVQHGRIHL